MTKRNSASPNPKRQAAGRRNHQKRRGFTLAGLSRLRATALAFCPADDHDIRDISARVLATGNLKSPPREQSSLNHTSLVLIPELVADKRASKLKSLSVPGKPKATGAVSLVR
jgi:hypothetical protein